jgi:predicted kinase
MVLMGLPAAGKSTYAAAQLHKGFYAFNADGIRDGERAFAAFTKMVKSAHLRMLQGHSVIVDACSLLPSNRTRVLHVGRNAGARCELVVVDTLTLVCMRREVNRGGPVRDWTALEKQLRVARDAARTEGWDQITVVRP